MKNIKKAIAMAHHRNRISLRNVTLGRRDWAGIAIWLTALSLITLAAL